MKKVYHLANCNTCQRIIESLNIGEEFEYQNIKTSAISVQQLETMKNLSGSYESLFSRRARKYRAMSLHEQKLSEEDYKRLILEEYTFLKRPVFIVDNQIFVGNAKKNIAALAKVLQVKS
jgi:arsenate reductase-like glutaredoxin family protein